MRKYLAFLLLVLAAPAASACGCAKPHRPADVGHYVHIFEGFAIVVTTSSQDGIVRQSVTFKVSRQIAGPVVGDVTVSFESGTTSCDLETPNFVVGERWLISDNDIYLAKDNAGVTDATKLVPSGAYSGNYCSLRERLAAAPEAEASN